MDMLQIANHLITTAPQWSLFVVALFSFFESFAFVGLFIPGTVAMLFFGVLAGNGSLSFWSLLGAATVGAFLGDAASFFLGKGADRLFRTPAGERLQQSSHISRAESFFYRYGGVSVFFGRFIGPIRPVIPFVAGMLRMKTTSFLWWDASSAFAWSFVLLGAGHFFGLALQQAAAWSARALMVVLALAVFAAFMWVVDRLFLRVGKRGFAITRRFFGLAAMRLAPFVERAPQTLRRLFRFLLACFSTSHFFGLPFTLLLFAGTYLTLLFGGLVRAVLQHPAIFAHDVRIANLVTHFYDPQLAHVFQWVTLLGKWYVVGLLLAVVSVWLLWRRVRYALLPLWVTFLGAVVFTGISKLLIERPRPAYALVHESSFAFPSGHATAAMAAYGFLTFLLLRLSKRFATKVNIFFFGTTLILLIGLTRLYLGVHYASDIVGGFLVGALWVGVGIALFEWERSGRGAFARWVRKREEWCEYMVAPIVAHGRVLVPTALLLWVSVFVLIGQVRIGPLLSPSSSDTVAVNVSYLDALLPSLHTRYTETIWGRTQEPLSLLVVAGNERELINAFAHAGWTLADPLSSTSTLRLFHSALTGAPYPNAPMTPSFWSTQVHALGFQKQLPGEGIEKRHHVRFWKTPWRFRGAKVFVGTASFDQDIKWLITHRIDPDIDRERDFLLHDLQQHNKGLRIERFSIVPPTEGKNFAGDPFYTDGDAYLVLLPSASKTRR